MGAGNQFNALGKHSDIGSSSCVLFVAREIEHFLQRGGPPLHFEEESMSACCTRLKAAVTAHDERGAASASGEWVANE
eukprot:1898497-Pyramimonas_sp.AAC.1